MRAGEQGAHLVTGFRGCPRGRRPAGRLGQTPPQRPGGEGDHEQVQEDDSDAQQPERRQRHRQPQHDHRPEAPGDLGETEQLAARLRGRELAHEREGGGHVGTDRDADHESPEEQHLAVHRQSAAQDARRINQQVVLVDPFAPQLVAEPAAAKRTEGATKRVGADRGEHTHRAVAQPEHRLEHRQARTERDDRTGVQVGRHAGEGGPFPLLAGDGPGVFGRGKAGHFVGGGVEVRV